MKTLTKNNINVSLIDKAEKINDPRDLLDLFATAQYECGCTGLIVFKENLNENFFDLKTRLAGDMLQKCSNYKSGLPSSETFHSTRAKASGISFAR